ncbi:MAG: hypothetical protein P0Y55_12135 [Candidatus Cohnella colombiensis]|uniref:Uncharacterized protein n=1 Tax=Candidatus Cohnella colombiensis TaxID=3121368 RepID=A0AA95J9I1_9BACL|nr:MAG: hypothetical protein P0Y55_12135 [Cohnella sp.]
MQVKVFSNKDRTKFENEINDWLEGKEFDSIQFQYGADFSCWSALVVYVLKV